jgi:hypothetical protein
MANTLRFKRGLASGIPTAAAGEPLFTTDTFDLYIGNGTNNTRFQKYIASGATTQILRGDGSLYTFPLAISSPTNGQVLKYNGTSWVNDSDSGITGSGSAGQVAYFTGATTQTGNNNLFFEATNPSLFIGIASYTTVNTYRYLVLNSASSTGGGVIDFALNGTLQGFIACNYSSSLNFNLGTSVSKALGLFTNNTERARIFANGNFGIGTGATDSGEKLQVTGTAKITGALTVNSQIISSLTNGSITIREAGNNVANNTIDLHIRPSSGKSGYISFTEDGVADRWSIGITNGDGRLYFRRPYFSSAASMVLDASGNLGLGVTPSAWSGGGAALQLNNGASLWTLNNQNLMLSQNSYFNGSSNLYIATAPASQYQQSSGTHLWRIAPSGTAGNAITFTQAMTLDASGNLLVGSATSSGERLQVTGTAKITGASSFGGNMTLSLNQNSATGINVNNTTSGTDSESYINFQSDSSSGTASISKFSTTKNAYKIISAKDVAFYNSVTGGDIVILNDFATGNIKFAAGGSSTAHLTIASTGAATFSSSVTAASGTFTAANNTATGGGQIYLNGATGNRIDFSLAGVGLPTFTTRSVGTKIVLRPEISASFVDYAIGINSNTLWFSVPDNASHSFAWYGGTTAQMQLVNGSLGIGISPSYKLHVQGTGYFNDNVRFPNQKGLLFVQTGGTLLGSIGMDSGNQVTIDNNGFFGLSVGSNYNLLGGNTGIGTSTFGTSATRTFAVLNGTAPSSSPADTFQMYSNDITAGNAAPHFRTENGAVIKLYQQDNGVAAANFIAGIGSPVTTLDAFDGYTIGQVVKALRNAGILS